MAPSVLSRSGGASRAATSVRTSRLLRTFKRIAIAIGGTLLVATLFIGFLHTKLGRPFLLKLAGYAGCPMGKANAAEVDVARRVALDRERGDVDAPSRPALTFALDEATLNDVRAWADRTGADCDEEREGSFVRCYDVDPSTIGAPSAGGRMTELAFGFSAAGRLVAVTALSSNRSATEASTLATVASKALASRLGPPHRHAGDLGAPGTTATVSYRFRDYIAEVTTTAVGGSGHVVREAYYSAR